MAKRPAGPVLKVRKTIPYEFVLEALMPLSPRTRPMFGCHAVYIGPRIVFILRDRPDYPKDNGVWLATTAEHHESLLQEFPNMRSLGLFGKEVTHWQILPSDSSSFESSVMRACDFVLAKDPRIGKLPKHRG